MDEEQLLARLTLVDDMSDKLLDIANAGMDMTSKLEQMSDTTNAAFNSVSEQASRSVSAAEELSSAMNGLNNSSMSAANGADYWTSAVSGYDKSALEAVYSTEQLVEKGYKSADALLEQSSVTETLDGAMNALVNEMDSAVSSQNELSQAIDNANTMLEDSINAENMSAEAKQELEQASNNAADALKELERAQNEAQAAMENFDSIMNAEVLDTAALADAAEQASRSSEALASAQDKANSAVSELSKATEDASKSIEEMGEKSEDSGRQGSDALSAIAETAVAVAIADKVKDITASVYEMSEAFSEAEKTVVNATGATGEALEGLDQSMMATFSTHHAELSDTAGAIGEINTRMGYTGEKLTDVTGKFLDFADITGSNVVTSVQNATKIMNKWNIEQDDLVSVLDKLAYEGQVSGASVDNLSSSLINGASSFQAMDLSLDSAISLLGALELQGINSSSVIMGLKTATKNFSKDGLDAASALRSTVDQIATMGDEAAATTLAIETFGSKAGVEMANAIRSGAITVEMLNGDLSEAEGTLQRTAQAGETLSEKWDKANNKITNALTNELQPTMDKVSGTLAGMVGWIGDFINEHPVVIKILGAFAAGLGVVTVALTAYTVAVNLVIPALTKFTAALSANPIGLWAIVAATAVATIGSLAVAFSDGADDVADYNGTLEECAKDIDNTRLAHEKAVEMYGAESAAAKELEGQLDTLNKQYQKGGGAAADYAQRAQKHAEAIRTLSDGYQDQISKISSDQTFALTAAAQLQALSEKAVITNSDLDLMGQYADHLNNTFECDIKVNYDTGELTGFDPNDISQMALKAYEASKRQLAFEQISSPKFIDDYQNLYRESRNFDTTPKGQTTFGKIVNMTDVMAADKAKSQLEEYRKKVIRYYEDMGYAGADAIAEAENYLRTLQQGAYPETTVVDNGRDTSLNPEKYGEVSSKMSELSGTANEAGDAVANLSTSIAEAEKAYTELYAAAKESFEGQFGLFDEAQKSADATVSKFEEAQRSQIEYWQSYSENISYLSQYSAEELGMSETAFTHFKELIASGSPEAAGLVASMRETIENEGIDAVRSVGETMSQVYDEQENAVVNTAEWGSGLKDAASLAVKNAVDAANSAAKGFTDAGTVAMDNFALGIRAGIGNAINAAQEVANNIQAVLGSIRVNIPSPTVNSASDAALRLSGQYATGTLDAAPGLALVGEKGPELINFGGGEVVYTAEETKQILSQQNDPSVYIPQNIDQALDISKKLSAIKSDNSFIILPEHKETSRNASASGTSTSEKRIVIDINGAGKIEVSGDADREVILEVLQTNLKPVLLGIISEEIYEEGDDSYEY